MNKIILLLVLGMGLLSTISTTAQEESFFTDPSLLAPWDQGTFDLGYVVPDILEKAQRYDSVMVDQPEIFVAADSKYKGAKPDHLKQLVDSMRLAMMERFKEGGWPMVDTPGPNVLYIRWAINDLYLQKQKRNLLSFTPVGMVVHATRQAAVRDLWKKINIVELGIKIEWNDSLSGEVLSAGTIRQGARKIKGRDAELVSWQDLDALFLTIGEQTRCHFDNTLLPDVEKRVDCDSLVIEPEI